MLELRVSVAEEVDRLRQSIVEESSSEEGVIVTNVNAFFLV